MTPPEDAPFAPRDWGLLLGAAAIWGASFLFTAIGLDSFEPGLVTLLRVGFGALTLGLLPGNRVVFDPRDRRRIALLGFTWMAFPLTLFPIAQQWVDSSLAGMLNSAVPVMTTLIAWLVFSNPSSLRRTVGIAVGVIGVVLIGVPEATTAGTNAVGVALIIVAVAAYGLSFNLAGPLQRKYGSRQVTARALAFASVMVMPYGLWSVPASSFAWEPLFACIALGAGGTGAAYAMAAMLTGRVGAVRSSLITYVVPAVSIVLGVVFRDESIAALAVIGTLVVLSGAWLSSRSG